MLEIIIGYSSSLFCRCLWTNFKSWFRPGFDDSSYVALRSPFLYKIKVGCFVTYIKMREKKINNDAWGSTITRLTIYQKTTNFIFYLFRIFLLWNNLKWEKNWSPHHLSSRIPNFYWPFNQPEEFVYFSLFYRQSNHHVISNLIFKNKKS